MIEYIGTFNSQPGVLKLVGIGEVVAGQMRIQTTFSLWGKIHHFYCNISSSHSLQTIMEYDRVPRDLAFHSWPVQIGGVLLEL
jgi:hypothetical protein